MIKQLVALSFLLIIQSTAAPELFACGSQELQNFVEKAQLMTTEAEALGQKLLSCSGEKREAFQWLYFWSVIKGKNPRIKWQSSTIKKTDSSRKNSAASRQTSLEEEIDSTYAGNYQILRGRLDAGDPQVSQNIEVQLGVARALTRLGNYSEGRHYYENALRIAHPDSRLHIERIYTFIWEGQLNIAERELSRLSGTYGDKYFSDAIQRGRILISQIRGRDFNDIPSAKTPSRPDAIFSAYGEYLSLGQQMHRYTGNIDFHREFDLSISHHIISQQVFEKSTWKRDNIWFGREKWKFGNFYTGSMFGYRAQAKKNRYLYRLNMGFDSEYVDFLLAADRTSLVENIPLTGRSIDIARDEINAKFKFFDQITLGSGLSKDTDRWPFARYFMETKTPLDFIPQSKGRISGLLGVIYEARSQPSPDYESFRQSIWSHVGTRIEQTVGSESDVILEMRYLNLQRQGHGMTTWAQNSAIRLIAEGRHKIDSKWHFVSRIAYNGEDTIRPTQPFQNRIEIRAGAELLP